MMRVLWRLVAPVLVALALATALAPFLYLGASDADEVAKRMTLTPAERLALVAMHRIGLAKLEEAEETDPSSAWSFVDDGAVALCARTPLTVGVAAAEGYARPAWRRSLELSVAHLWHDLSGAWPDWSYGLGQIRLSTARGALAAAARRYVGPSGPILAAVPDNEELVALLANPCANLFLTRLVLDSAPGLSDAEAARRYRGGEEGEAILAGIGYEDLVARVAAATRVRDISFNSVVVALKGGNPEATEMPSLHLVERFAELDGPVPIACFRRTELYGGGPAAPYAVFPQPDRSSLGDNPERTFEVDPAARPASGVFEGVIPEDAELAVALIEDEPGDLALLAAAADAARGLAATGLDPAGPWRRVSFARATSDGLPHEDCEVVISIAPPPVAFFAAWAPILKAAVDVARDGEEGGFDHDSASPPDEP